MNTKELILIKSKKIMSFDKKIISDFLNEQLFFCKKQLLNILQTGKKNTALDKKIKIKLGCEKNINNYKNHDFYIELKRALAVLELFFIHLE